MALTDFLTEIADSIRSKDGTTAVINAQDFASRILSIPSGGSETATGTFTVAEDTACYRVSNSDRRFHIAHGLNSTPDGFLVFPEKDIVVNDAGYLTNASFTFAYFNKNMYSVGRMYNDTGGSTGTSAYNISNESFYIEANSVDLIFGGNSSTCFLRAGCTYRWFAWGYES